MKTKFILLLSILSLQLANAQNYQTIAQVDDACTQLGFMSDEDAQITVDNILQQVGLFSNFTIAECPDINNAIAKMIEVEPGKKARYVLYDSAFFDRISDKASNDWAATSILAHEIGHHLNGHSINNKGSNHKWELEADEFSGFVLAKMGASIDDAQSAMKTLTYEKATRTHPAKADRLLAIEKGWNRGTSKKLVASETPIQDEEVVDVVEDAKVAKVVPDEPKKKEAHNQKVVMNDDGSKVGTREGDLIFTNENKLRAQQIMSKHIDAIGGEESILGIKSLYKKALIDNTDYTMTMISPNNFITEYISNDYESYYLHMNGYVYSKSNKTEPWNYFSFNENQNVQSSYILEYGYLIQNKNIAYTGLETIDGVSYQVVRLPDFFIEVTNETLSMNTSSERYLYYSSVTDLLTYTKIITNSETHFFKDNTVSEDTSTVSEIVTKYSDYRDVAGVLFAFKEEAEITTGETETLTVMIYEKIEVNPLIDRADFKIDK